MTTAWASAAFFVCLDELVLQLIRGLLYQVLLAVMAGLVHQVLGRLMQGVYIAS